VANRCSHGGKHESLLVSGIGGRRLTGRRVGQGRQGRAGRAGAPAAPFCQNGAGQSCWLDASGKAARKDPLGNLLVK
jgi:hypothetical protein